ncbi:hypothetical protein THRCLA_21326 [Thraustotheca clavata]|uniref:Uncharacterized protein n=1 Tax=Thraustotheca clavata TaxID=74557 RepID=A0A1V9ZXQ7_9STRA|nr:hypothetical protein THRCLA_21326 [Thraustotheca clavata]
MAKRAYATLLGTNAYVTGAEVLRSSLLSAGSPYPLVIMYTPQVTQLVLDRLSKLDNIVLHPIIPITPTPTQMVSYAFDRFKEVWAKLHVFELDDYDMVVFLDADMLCLNNMDELFDMIGNEPTSLVASLACICNPHRLAHYPKWWCSENCSYSYIEKGLDASHCPKYFNSGMFVLHPSKATFARLENKMSGEEDLRRFFFPDQCFLNEVFPDFTIANYKYNALKTLRNAHSKLWNIKDVKNVHYILQKPWEVDRKDKSRSTEYDDLYQLWWNASTYATLLGTDTYMIGAEVLCSSLLAANSPYPLVIMYTPQVTQHVLNRLSELENIVLHRIAPLLPTPAQMVNYAFDRFKQVWAKLRVFELVDYDTVVFLDADMLCLNNMDELFDKIGNEPTSLVASLACICNPHRLEHYPKSWCPENCSYTYLENGLDASHCRKYFNSGMFVLHPNKETFARLEKLLHGEKDLTRFYFADQCFLNEAFPDFTIASYTYNALKTLRNAHSKLWDIKDVKNVHYILRKPWEVDQDDKARTCEYDDLYQLWWNAASNLPVNSAQQNN